MNPLGLIVWRSLRQAHWLPSIPSSLHESLFADLAPGEDILPTIAMAWSRADVAGSERKRGSRLLAWMQAQIAGGARLTCGPDPARYDGFRRWSGERFIWWPRGIPAGERVGLISSHLGRNLNQAHDWFRALRATCAKVDRRHVLVTAATTTTHPFARRAAELFELRCLLLIPPGKREGCPTWLDKLARQEWPDTSCHEAHVSPVLDLDQAGASPEFAESPLADRMSLAMSDRLLLFHLRRRGKLLPLIRRRLADAAWPPQSVQVALGPGLVPRSIADPLLAAGAVGWLVLGDSSDERPAPSVTSDADVAVDSGVIVGSSARIFAGPPRGDWPLGDWPYLTHCTRAAPGAWPDQSAEEFLDELIFSMDSADHSALAALRRILVQQQLLGTGSAIRGGADLVSFTAAPLADLPRLRTFRVHRGRWDFEPYGLCIRREYLQRVGARPVVYGNHADWDRLSDVDRPYFQRRVSRNAKTGASIDWSREREWRVLGNVDLTRVDDDTAFAFVPSIDEALALLPDCRWPIVVLEKR